MSVIAERDFAQSVRTDIVQAQVGENAATILDVSKAAADANSATASKVSQLDAKVDSNAATFKSETTALANADKALTQKIDTVQAVSGENTAAVQQVSKALSDVDKALTQKIDTVQAASGENSAAVQQVSKAVADVNGRVSAQTTINAETIAGGRKVMAGLSIAAGDTSEILAFAQRFAIIDEVTGQLRAPFIVQGGQVFINYAMIDTAFIQNLVLGMTLRSSAVNSQGLPLLEINIPQGKLILRGSTGEGTSEFSNDGLKYFLSQSPTPPTIEIGKLT